MDQVVNVSLKDFGESVFEMSLIYIFHPALQ